MELANETRQNTRDIAALTAAVARLATIVEYAEKEHEDDRKDMREIVTNLKSINEKMGALGHVQEKLGEMAGEVGKFRHDVRNLEMAQLAIPLLKEKFDDAVKKIIEHEMRLDELKQWKDRADGATGTVKVIIHSIWAFVSVGGVGFITWMVGLWGNSGGRIGGE